MIFDSYLSAAELGGINVRPVGFILNKNINLQNSHTTFCLKPLDFRNAQGACAVGLRFLTCAHAPSANYAHVNKPVDI